MSKRIASRSKEYDAWKGMWRRCTDPAGRYWGLYGGRGIEVCQRWRGFIAFYNDMGPAPSPSHSLDRIDSDGNYEPSNVRWATPTEQANNTRRNVLFTHEGRTQTVGQWATELGLGYSTVWKRIKQGRPINQRLWAKRQEETQMNTKKITLVDADGALYSAALKGQALCDGEPMQLLDDEFIYTDALNRLSDLAALAGDATQVIIALTDRRNFRLDILPTYKGNRKATIRPVALDALRRNVMERKDVTGMMIEGLEADDVCGIAAGLYQSQGYSVTIVSYDKDLATIPNVTLIRPDPKVRGKFTRLEVTEEIADRCFLMQTLTGDTVDGYKGCPGMGPRKAGRLLDMCQEEDLTLAETWKEIVMAFEDAGLTEEDALVQARVARILRVTDWDATAKEPILWVPPVDDPDTLLQRKAA